MRYIKRNTETNAMNVDWKICNDQQRRKFHPSKYVGKSSNSLLDSGLNIFRIRFSCILTNVSHTEAWWNMYLSAGVTFICMNTYIHICSPRLAND